MAGSCRVDARRPDGRSPSLRRNSLLLIGPMLPVRLTRLCLCWRIHTGDSVARRHVRREAGVLIVGRRLADLMIDYGVGVSLLKAYELKRVDEDYFADDERLSSS